MSEQTQAPQEEQQRVPLQVSNTMLSAIMAGLYELPFKHSEAVIADISKQVEELNKQAEAQMKAEEKEA